MCIAAVVLCLLAGAIGPISAADLPLLPTLAVRAHSDWLNVRDFGARGDGTADDSAAIQPGNKTVYFPPGTYAIASTLRLHGSLFGSIMGCGAASRLLWIGEANASIAMLVTSSFAYSRFRGLVFDGQNKAGIGIDHASVQPPPPPYHSHFETYILHENEAFVNFLTAGVRAGVCPAGSTCYETAETLYRNCIFANAPIGVALLFFNDYDHTFDGCHFQDLQWGIFSPRGIFYVRNSRFERQTQADLLAPAGDATTVRRVVSVNSTQFMVTNFSSYACPIHLESLLVVGWNASLPAVAINCPGPIMVMDVTFASPAQDTSGMPFGAAISFQGAEDLTVARLVASNIVAPAGWANVTSSNLELQTFAVPPGALQPVPVTSATQFLATSWPVPQGPLLDAKTDFGAAGDGKTDDTLALQKMIDAALASSVGAEAYIPAGTYVVSRPLIAACASPPCNLSITSGSATLHWAGPTGSPTLADMAILVICAGPQFAVTVRDLNLQATNAVHLLATRDCAAESGIRNGGGDGGGGGGGLFLEIDSVYLFAGWPNSVPVALVGLQAPDVVHVYRLSGQLNISDCDAATILSTFHEGPTSIRCNAGSGFIGELTKVTDTIHTIITGSCDYVIGEEYHEGNGVAISVSGGSSQQRLVFGQTKLNNANNIPSVQFSDFAGSALLLGATAAYNQFIMAGSATASATIMAMADGFFNFPPLFNVSGTTPSLIAAVRSGLDPCNASACVFPDQLGRPLPQLQATLGLMLDKLRQLGSVDWAIKYPALLAGRQT